ncbi:MAG TPA: efflux RND transporter periplasmic adaptor subunit [Acidobacteriaceae bacterium]|nr:efflux RND transporter periplasmic adaptor subunit [Acidobacteriaceae bacterium]
MPIHNTDAHTDINTDRTTPSADYAPSEHPIPPHPDPAHALPSPQRLPGGILITLIVIAFLLLAGIVYRFLGGAADERHLANQTKLDAVPTVDVVSPIVSGATSEIALPGNTQAFDDTPIYARTSGYLKQWFVDIGQHVSKGELMATIETPELDEQLQVAQADLKSAQADLNLATTTSERFTNLLKLDSVSQQETDVAVSGAAAKRAAVEAAQANVRRLSQLQSFEKIYAPYSGIVTQRNTDIGDLINAGSATTTNTAKELFHIASVDQLRVFVAVPEVYAPDIHNGDTATLTLDEYPDQVFTGVVTRNSGSIDPSSRTLNVEVDVNNHNAKLLPGAYVFVHFKIPVQSRELSIPADALIFRAQGLQVGVVRNGHVHLQTITIGKDNGKTVEVATGLSATDKVILSPSDSLAEGQPVTIANQPAVIQ